MDTPYWRRARLDTTDDVDEGRVYDVVIIGAGFAGLSTALHVLERASSANASLRSPITLAVLESCEVGAGASGRAAGMLLDFPLVPAWLVPGSLPHDERAWMADTLRAVVSETVQRLERSGAELPPADIVLSTQSWFGARALRWLEERAGASNVPFRGLGRDEVAERCGGIARRGLLLGARRVQPHALALHLAREVQRRGGLVCEGARVHAIEPGSTTILQTARGVVRARRVVVCTNAYSYGIAGLQGPKQRADGIRGNVVLSYMLATATLPDETLARLGGEGTLVGELSTTFAYRRVHERRLVFGGLDIRDRQPYADATRDSGARRRLRALLKRTLPWLGDVPIEHEWGGAFLVAPTEVPTARVHPQHPSIVLNVGFAGAGIALSLASGAWVSDLVLEERTDDRAARLRDGLARTRLPILGAAGVGLSLLHPRFAT